MDANVAEISALACDNAAHAIGCNPRTRTCSTAGDLQTSGENASYLRKHLHSALEAREHRLREARLQEIVEELGRLTKTKIL